MSKGAFHWLFALSLLLPVIVIAGFLGGPYPKPLIVTLVCAASVSALAGGVMAIWALRLVDRDVSLPAKEKKVWRKFISFTGIIAASLCLRGYLCSQTASRT